jgi:hypothetical protein
MTTTVQTFDPAKEKQRLSLQEIWRIGCRGESLSNHDREYFVKLARNRFHAFQLGIQHALDVEEDDSILEPLMRGLAAELHEAPGLALLWYDSGFCQSKYGRQVSRQLKRRDIWSRFGAWFRWPWLQV